MSTLSSLFTGLEPQSLHICYTCFCHRCYRTGVTSPSSLLCLLYHLCYANTGTTSPSSCRSTLPTLLQDWNHKSFIMYAYFVISVTGLGLWVLHPVCLLCHLFFRTGTTSPTSCMSTLSFLLQDCNHKSYILYAYFVISVIGLEPQVLHPVCLLCHLCYRTGTTSPSSCMPTLPSLL
jgi:hypothetical protein